MRQNWDSLSEEMESDACGQKKPFIFFGSSGLVDKGQSCILAYNVLPECLNSINTFFKYKLDKYYSTWNRNSNYQIKFNNSSLSY